MTRLRGIAAPLTVLAFLLIAPAWSAASAQTGEPGLDEAYGYFRTVEGRTVLSSREPDETRDVEVNLPILSGDAVQVAGGSRLEAVLADGSVARLEAGTELVFDQLARSPDSPEDAVTRLVLLTGEMQIRVPAEAVEPDPIEIESDNTRIYLIRGGSYWVGVAGPGETVLVVREGSAEVLTDQGSVLVHGGEEVRISGSYAVSTSVALAGRERGIELWARDLEAEAYAAQVGPVDENLAYAAAPLERAGTWVQVDGRAAWRPRVRYGWRPFTDGYWVYTPSGLTWVAEARWGWVTAHYGTWDYLPSYGWCWFPGRVYSPAWVYWYWGPSHAAWVPYGYYARHYGWGWGYHHGHGYHHGYGLRFGVYGWASGGWSVFADWTFCPLGYFGRRGGRYYHRSGADLARHHRALAVPRGIITTDTRRLDSAVWTRPYEVRRRLGEVNRSRVAKGPALDRDGLPDVTSFVARRRDLSAEVRDIVKPRRVDEGKPVLRQSARRSATSEGRTPSSVSRLSTKPSGDLDRESSVTRLGSGIQRREGLRRGTREVTSSSLSRSRFEKPSARRPTEFDRAPTSIYSESETRRVMTSPRAADSTRRQLGKRPEQFDRAPTSIYERPASSDRAPITRAGDDTPSRPTGTRLFGSAPRELPEGSPGVQRSTGSGHERPAPRASQGSSATRPEPRSRIESSSGSGRPPARVTPERPPTSRPPAASAPSRAPARRVVESSRSSSSRSRASSGSGSSGSRVQPQSSPRRESPSARSSTGSRSSSSSKGTRSQSSSGKRKDR